ncbi:MAG: hypothetical protein ABSG91_21925 [Syntrophobacteraceae bacterium]
MKYYQIEPEVAGGIGEHSVIDRSSGKMIVRRLHYVFDDWGGDVLLESCPCFIVTESAKKKLQSIGATGIRFDKVEVTTSELFQELVPDLELPKFVWLQIVHYRTLFDEGPSQPMKLANKAEGTPQEWTVPHSKSN